MKMKRRRTTAQTVRLTAALWTRWIWCRWTT